MNAARGITKLDLWVAGTMFNAAVAEARLSQVGMSRKQAIEAAKEIAGTPPLAPLTATRGSILSAFGAPAIDTVARLTYDLVLWPEHLYVWDISGADTVLFSGFVRRVDSTIAPIAGRSLVSIRRSFVLWSHTTTDILSVLGPPSREDGWWPERVLFYPGEDAETEIRLALDHELLCEVTERPRT